jgi:hypothetical protein
MPITAADTLYDRVLPFYEALGVLAAACLMNPMNCSVVNRLFFMSALLG